MPGNMSSRAEAEADATVHVSVNSFKIVDSSGPEIDMAVYYRRLLAGDKCLSSLSHVAPVGRRSGDRFRVPIYATYAGARGKGLTASEWGRN